MKKILFTAALVCAVMTTACGDKGGVRLGSLSEFDSLSYALGANMGYGMNYEMQDIPFDLEQITKGINDGGLGKATVEHDAAVDMLREYFMTKRPERSQQIAMQRAEQDSIRMAAGDTTVMDRPVADAAMFADEKERGDLSYAFGSDIGFNLSNSGLNVALVWVGEALHDVKNGTAKMTEEQVSQFLQDYFTVKLPAENAAASEKWLEKMAKKSGVKKTESGLLYKVIEAGDESVKAANDNDVVKVLYTGRTRTGKVFDSNIFENLPEERQKMLKEMNPEGYDKNEPAEFALNRVIKGWTEGMKLVGKGGKIKLWIPSELAYGQRGAGRDIGANEALEFEVEVVDVTPYVEPAPVVEEEVVEIVE